MVMRIDEVVAVIFVSGEVDLLHALHRNRIQIVESCEFVVHGTHVDVVHIEQQEAVGPLRDRAHEFPLRELRVAKVT